MKHSGKEEFKQRQQKKHKNFHNQKWRYSKSLKFEFISNTSDSFYNILFL
ncbi:Uncharacterized protein dnm_075780 [Desulfonema magnum]|uniref:Uncharacterized protein n=1 Tax=Desulfonema magnum TaxID=45655 RepID=A0A975BUR0_9BACT|nr:Uncharacterized protein dnm_075780 [Desulfonema magnum]